MPPRTWRRDPRRAAALLAGAWFLMGSLPADASRTRSDDATRADALTEHSQPAENPPVDADRPPETEDTEEPAADPSDDREARVVMTDGRTFTGIVVERDDEYVVLKISGIRTPFPTRDIDKIDLFPTNRERYQTLREALDPKDFNSRLRLAEWLRGVEMLDEALVELDAVIAADPANAKAREFRTIVEQQIKLRSRSLKNRKPEGQPTDGQPSNTQAPDAPGRRKQRQPDFPLLTQPEINLIRVYELNLADPPRMKIPRGTIDRLMEAYAGDERIPTTREGREALHRKSPAEIVDLMFQLRARDFYDQVQVLDDPESMRRFREHVHAAWLLNACASNDCHGGTEAGRLWLHNKNRNAAPTVYTNFLILERFEIQATRGERKGERVRLIDYANPERSPLLQLALPRDESLFPHPEVSRPGVPVFKSVFRSEDDPRYRRAVEWIESMYQPRPNYGINYNPPIPRSVADATRPDDNADDDDAPAESTPRDAAPPTPESNPGGKNDRDDRPKPDPSNDGTSKDQPDTPRRPAGDDSPPPREP